MTSTAEVSNTTGNEHSLVDDGDTYKRSYKERVLQVTELCKKLKQVGFGEGTQEYEEFKKLGMKFIKDGKRVEEQIKGRRKMNVVLTTNKNVDCSISMPKIR